MKTFEVVCKEVADLTFINNHCEARLEIARFIEDKLLVEFYSEMIKVRDAAGYLPEEQGNARYEMEPTLYKKVKEKLGIEQGKLLISNL